MEGWIKVIMKNYQIANKLDFMQNQKNNGRGISCIRTIVTFLDRDDFESARAVVNNEWDKIRSYKDIAQYLVEQKLYSE